jgi:hypothetical protein
MSCSAAWCSWSSTISGGGGVMAGLLAELFGAGRRGLARVAALAGGRTGGTPPLPDRAAQRPRRPVRAHGCTRSRGAGRPRGRPHRLGALALASGRARRPARGRRRCARRRGRRRSGAAARPGRAGRPARRTRSGSMPTGGWPPATVSTHSVLSRRVRQGTPWGRPPSGPRPSR